jgi:UDP-N-acetylglucosamine 2-epimerase (non-hydrolysing)
MIAFEELFARENPDAVMVVGDVNPTLAAAVSAAKVGVPVIHLEAGLRCNDMRVPEEVNRVLISRVSALHLAPTEKALETLEDEGVDPERIHFVGNVLAESVMRHLDDIRNVDASSEYGLAAGAYILGSFHRPENLSSRQRLEGLLDGLARAPLPVVVPDTASFIAAVSKYGLEVPDSVHVVDSLEYRHMLALIRDASAVLTDSSGVQEEACTIGTPCVTVRDCTEQTATVDCGANTLVAADGESITAALTEATESRRTWIAPKRWDRAVSERVVRAIRRGVEPLV